LSPTRSTHPRPLWCLLLFLFTHPLGAFEPGPVQDAYALGMGGAGIAVAGGTHSVFLNPAGTARSSTPLLQVGFGFSHSGDLRLDTSVLYPFRDGTVFSLSQGSDLPSSPVGSTLVAASVGLPLDSSRDLFLGLNMKHLSLSADLGGGPERGSGFGLDLGVAYDLRRPEGTLASFALTLLDLASQLRFDNNQERSLSRRAVLGAAYLGIPETRLEVDYSLVEKSAVSPLEDRLRIGAERFFADRFFSARAGLDGAFNRDVRLAVGFGYHPDRPFELCYAFQAALNDPTLLHSVAFIWRFDEPGPGQANAPTPVKGSSPEILLAKLPPSIPVGRPISPLPLRKVTIKSDPPYLSPASPKNKVVLTFPEGAPPETSKWRLDIQGPGGSVVRSLEGTGSLPASLLWDGRSLAGKAVQDAKYDLVLKTFDPTGKILSDDKGSVEVLSSRPKFALLAGETSFSTRGARGLRSEAGFSVEPGGPWEVATWEFEVTEPSSGRKVHQRSGKGSLPKGLRWNGRGGKDAVGEGAYLARLTAVDQAGNPLRSDSVRLTIDNTAPKVSFRPGKVLVDTAGGESFKFSVDAEDLSGIQVWKAEFLLPSGEVAGRLEGKGTPAAQVAWDGRSPAGTMVAPGSLVMVTFQAQDRAGNRTQTLPSSLQVDFKPTSAGGQMTLSLTTVRFAEKSAELDEAARQQLSSSASSIRQYLEKSVLVVKGYAVEGEAEDTVLLSHQRAAQVKDFLVRTLGVPASSVHAVGHSVQKASDGQTAPSSQEGQRKAVVTLTTQP